MFPLKLAASWPWGYPDGGEGGPDVQGCDVRVPITVVVSITLGTTQLLKIISWADEAFKITQIKGLFMISKIKEQAPISFSY